MDATHGEVEKNSLGKYGPNATILSGARNNIIYITWLPFSLGKIMNQQHMWQDSDLLHCCDCTLAIRIWLNRCGTRVSMPRPSTRVKHAAPSPSFNISSMTWDGQCNLEVIVRRHRVGGSTSGVLLRHSSWKGLRNPGNTVFSNTYVQRCTWKIWKRVQLPSHSTLHKRTPCLKVL